MRDFFKKLLPLIAQKKHQLKQLSMKELSAIIKELNAEDLDHAAKILSLRELNE